MPKIPQRSPQSTTPKSVGKRRVQCRKLENKRRLSNADECVGYIVKTKAGFKAGTQNYELRQGSILDVFTGENEEGYRIASYTIELDTIVLVDVPAEFVDWVGMPK